MRKNQATLTAAEKTAFVNAVLAVKRKPSILHPEDRSLSRYDDFVEIHLNAMMVMMNNQPSWAHQGPVFGPWHRVMLRQFELELQQIDAQVEMPYWDWTQGNSRSRTSSLWQNDFLGPDGRTSGLQSGKVMSGPFAFDAGNWLIRVKDQPRDPDYLIRRLGRTLMRACCRPPLWSMPRLLPGLTTRLRGKTASAIQTILLNGKDFVFSSKFHCTISSTAGWGATWWI